MTLGAGVLSTAQHRVVRPGSLPLHRTEAWHVPHHRLDRLTLIVDGDGNMTEIRAG
ncbi:MAG: hypothetical protein ACR2JU_09070 [Nocardioidaceae bacterium]